MLLRLNVPHNNEMQLTGRVLGRGCAFAQPGIIVAPAAYPGVLRTCGATCGDGEQPLMRLAGYEHPRCG
jgi:hypothetical protein